MQKSKVAESGMQNYIKSELLKNKRSFAVKMVFLIPVVCILCAVFLMNGGYVQTLAYNWWYLIFLPFILVYLCGHLIRFDMKPNFHGLFSILTNKSLLAYAKVIVATIYLMLANWIFFLIIFVAGIVFGTQINVVDNLLAAIVLTLTFAWQIPFFMLVSKKINVFVSILVSVVCNLGIACLAAMKSLWWIPFAIPARMMYHVLGILPNGLVENSGEMNGGAGVLSGGILIGVVLYIIMTYALGKAFMKQEV